MAKVKQPVRSFSEQCSNVTLAGAINNKTPIHRAASMMLCSCPVCSIEFYRKASEVRRHDVAYCSRACAGFASRRRVAVACRICSTLFHVKQSDAGVITCCSENCRRIALGVSSAETIFAGKNPKLFMNQVQKIPATEIPAILANPKRHWEIAKEYAVTRAAISAIKRKHKHKHK